MNPSRTDRSSQESKRVLRSNSKSQQSSSNNPQERRFLQQNNQRQRVQIRSQQESQQQSPYGHIQDNQSFVTNTQEQATFWGTNIIVEETEVKFLDFLQNFKGEGRQYEMEIEEAQQEEVAVYMEKLQQIHATQIYSLVIEGEHLFQFDKNMYYQLTNFPGEIIPIFDKVAQKYYVEYFGLSESDMEGKIIQVGFSHLRTATRIRELGPKDINKLVMFQGIVIRCSQVLPEMKDGCFRCQACGRQEMANVERGRLQEPNDCPRCRCKNSFELIHNLSYFIDKQYVKLQENPESIPDGETPCTITMMAYENNVDSVKPGDKVQIIGIYRASGVRLSPKQRVLKSVFRTYIDVVSYFTKNKAQDQSDTAALSPTNLYAIHALSQDPLIYDKLIKAFAPSIWENNDVKKGLLCQLFGGTLKTFSQSGKGRLRSEINVLMIGDPSTAKSQFLQFVHKISPRGIYTSGKGSSAVGLTAYVTTDPETKELILESGALVLSDKGICCIDEFDKMNDQTQSILHEAMEQQTISVAKAGIVCQLNSRTAILASANPKDSKYNPKKSVIDNINIGPTLMSRFDLLYLMLDKQNSAHDERLASHILSLYSPDYAEQEGQHTPEISREMLAMYISYARVNVQPVIGEESVIALVEGYCEMRKMGMNRKTITATPRQLESLIRLAEAHTKMRLGETVLESDVQEAIRLMKVATHATATDPLTGEIDMDAINTGITFTSKKTVQAIVQAVKHYLKDNAEQLANRTLPYQQLKDVLLQGSYFDQAFDDKEYDEALNILEEDNFIIKHATNNRMRPSIRLGTGNLFGQI